MLIGTRYRSESTIVLKPTQTDRMSNPEAACSTEAPTWNSPDSTTAKEATNPTMVVTRPAIAD